MYNRKSYVTVWSHNTPVTYFTERVISSTCSATAKVTRTIVDTVRSAALGFPVTCSFQRLALSLLVCQVRTKNSETKEWRPACLSSGCFYISPPRADFCLDAWEASFQGTSLGCIGTKPITKRNFQITGGRSICMSECRWDRRALMFQDRKYIALWGRP